MKKDIKNISTTEKVIIQADKTTNFYKMTVQNYNKLLSDTITKTYKKTNDSEVKEIVQTEKELAERLHLADRVDYLAQKEAFISIKDHKENFPTTVSCRLINPAKTEIGKVSKIILENINSKIVSATKINLWKNTAAVINWFNNLQNKSAHHFLVFDVIDFYPSITEPLLQRALDFAEQYCSISKVDREIILRTKHSLLFHNKTPWHNRTHRTSFDITMGSYDGAEVCELVGSYILSILSNKFGDAIGLYRDDGLAVFNQRQQEIEKIKKEIAKVFKEQQLKVIIKANMKQVDFLDVTFNLESGEYWPYNKPGNIPIYVHANSNHPESIKRNIPKGINTRLAAISSNRNVFNNNKKIYQDALNTNGYKQQP